MSRFHQNQKGVRIAVVGERLKGVCWTNAFILARDHVYSPGFTVTVKLHSAVLLDGSLKV